MVTNRASYQSQSWIPNEPGGDQAVFIPTAGADNCPVSTIIEEHKLYFNLCVISLCLCRTQKSILPGMYIDQFNQLHATLIKVCVIH